MNSKKKIHDLIKKISNELLIYIKDKEPLYEERWVPRTEITKELDLNFFAVPKANKQYGEKGWFFSIIARMLEDEGLIEYEKLEGRAFYRTK
ncbi:MAG: hypothetical protein JRJ49_08365 [Deltaproteobacteria bacterium]|nr:hypothetical protein [Deltaproteobacteria bacterium]